MTKVAIIILAMSVSAVALMPVPRKTKLLLMALLVWVAATNALIDWVLP